MNFYQEIHRHLELKYDQSHQMQICRLNLNVNIVIMRRCRNSRSPPGFFGLSLNYRKILFQQIFDLTYHGKGFTHNEVYHMPIWMRRNYIQMVNETIDRQNKDQEKFNKENKSFAQNQQNPSTRVQRPDIKNSKNIMVNRKGTNR